LERALFEIGIMNPRGSKKRRSKRRSNPAMKRNKKGRFVKRASNPRKKRRAKHRKSNPRRRHVKHRRRSNPRRHRKHARRANPRRHVKHRRRSNPRSHRKHRRHRNPRFLAGLQGGILGHLQEGAIGGAGALINSVLLGYALPMLPATFTTGYALSAVRITAATLFGMLAKRFGGRMGETAGKGATAVAMYLLFRDIAVSMAPTLPLGDYEEISIDSTSDQIGAYMDPATRLSGFLPDGSRARQGTGAYLSAYMSGHGDNEKFYGNDGQGFELAGLDY
jgi:hypothetical protein